MSKERNPKEFYENRVLQLNNNAPIFGKMVRKKVIEEICNTKFVGWYNEKVAAIVAGLNNSDKAVQQIAENYLLGLDTNEEDQKMIDSLCEYFIEKKDNKVLRIIRQKNFNKKFDDLYKQIEFECSVFGIDKCKQTLDQLTFEQSFKVLQNTEIIDLKNYLTARLRHSINKSNIQEVYNLFLGDYHHCYCEYIHNHLPYMTFQDRINYIESIPKIRGFDGNKESLLKEMINKIDADIKKNPSIVDAHFLLKKYHENFYNDWMLDLLVKNRPLLSTNNELALCNHFKEYDKVRDKLMNFELEELCDHYPYFVGTPIECMFAQKLRMTIKKQNYKFNFNLLKDFFELIEENLKIEVFKMLSNFSTPQFYDFVLFQMNKISEYSKDEQRIYLEEIIPFYIPMYSRLSPQQQIETIRKLPDFDFASLSYYINCILRMKIDRNIIIYIENLLKVVKFRDDQKFVIIEIVLNQRPDLFKKSRILQAVKPKYDQKLEEIELLLGQLEFECSRQYLRDDRTGHNLDIDKQRDKLIKEIQKIDLEKAIEILLPHYDEKNYRLKKDVKKILMGTYVGFKILIPYAFTSGMENRDLRDFCVELLEKRIQPYLPFRPTIKIKRENFRYVEMFMSEKDLTFRNLAKNIKRCNIVLER